MFSSDLPFAVAEQEQHECFRDYLRDYSVGLPLFDLSRYFCTVRHIKYGAHAKSVDLIRPNQHSKIEAWIGNRIKISFSYTCRKQVVPDVPQLRLPKIEEAEQHKRHEKEGRRPAR